MGYPQQHNVVQRETGKREREEASCPGCET
jgi:hypothetical protein